MDKIFENLRENVSEACFEDIMSMVEAYINESPTVDKVRKAAENSVPQRMARAEANRGETGVTWKDIERVQRARNLSEMPSSDKPMKEYQKEVKGKMPEIQNNYRKAFKNYEDKVFRTGTDATDSSEFKKYAKAADEKAKANDVLSVGKPKSKESSLSRYI